ncbi:MAG: hypothetical protein JNL50_07965 [Phycisphaerae bacterium]|nr:hypothetical protein [Phycisphaerae bacterium]
MSGQKQVSPDGVRWWEVAASGSPTDHKLLLVGSYDHAPVVTTNATVTVPTFHPGPALLGGDPFATTFTTFNGRIYIGALVGSVPNGDPGGMRFTYYDPGQTMTQWSANPITTIANDGLADKPWLAIGPSSVPFGEINYYTMSMRSGTGCATDKVWVYRAPVSSIFSPWASNSAIPINPAASNCESTPTCNYRGWGSMPVVTDEGDIVAVVRDTNVGSGGPGCYNERRPYVIWSDDDGYTWQPGGSVPIKLGDGLVEAIGTKVPATAISDTPFYVDRRANAPSIAIDRATNTIYVAFAGRSGITPEGEPDGNSDIWIFRGTKDFPTQQWIFGTDPDDVLHLTDDMLDLDINTDGRGPDQFMPAIAIDCAGAINLMFYDNRAETEAPTIPDASNTEDGRLVEVYYARITGWPNGTTNVYTKALTPEPFAVFPSDGYLGDYHTIASGGSAGKWLYPVYIGKGVINPPPSGPGDWGVPTCYAHSVFIRLCTADTNQNRMADSNDLQVFWDAYAEGEELADVTDDGLVNGDDVDEFIDVYSDVIGG